MYVVICTLLLIGLSSVTPVSGKGSVYASYAAHATPFFNHLDENSDGLLTAHEAEGRLMVFVNTNNGISPHLEFYDWTHLPEFVLPTVEGFPILLQEFDKNGDEALSKEEMTSVSKDAVAVFYWRVDKTHTKILVGCDIVRNRLLDMQQIFNLAIVTVRTIYDRMTSFF
uniref:EF-hand domain-containing protein n=1 Tax=Ciona savignyi TaxID=51511 RepID=H2YLR4_CIOSA